MAKIIVERPRVGGGPRKRPEACDLEDLPSREGMRRAHKDRKELNENLAPLRRYLISKAGKHWDKVHSDICEHIKLSSAVQRHILEHLKWMVKTDCFIGPDGKVWEHGYGYGSKDRPISEGFKEFYVHPKSKVLHYQQWKKNWYKRNQKPDPNRKVTGDLMQIHKIDGVWYEIHLKKLPAYVETKNKNGLGTVVRTTWDGLYDVLLKQGLSRGLSLKLRSVHGDLKERYGHDDVYCVKKIQCSKKMLKKWGLK